MVGEHADSPFGSDHPGAAERFKFFPETPLMSSTDTTTTVKTYLRPIDRDGLLAFAEKGRNNPASRGTNKVHTVVEGQYRTLSYVGNHAPVVVDEPPAPVRSGHPRRRPARSCCRRWAAASPWGITAVATWKQVKLSKLELFLEGDIGNPAAWGAGGALKAPADMGFQAIRVKVVVEGDATREVLDEIVKHANMYSPVANSMRNPIPFQIDLA